MGLALIIYAMAGVVLAGTLMVAALTIGTSTQVLIAAALVGFVLAAPVAWIVARRLSA